MSKTSASTGCRSRDQPPRDPTVPQHDIASTCACGGARRGPAGRDHPGQRAHHHPDGRNTAAIRPARIQDGGGDAVHRTGSPKPRRASMSPGARNSSWRGACRRRARDRGPLRRIHRPLLGRPQMPCHPDRPDFPSHGPALRRPLSRNALDRDRLSAGDDDMRAALPAAQADFPEVLAVNAMYTHGLVVVVSTRNRYGGFAKAVGMRVLTTTHGLGYAKIVIVVDEDVDPFNLTQVMWALSTKVNPAGDLVPIPNLRRTCSIRRAARRHRRQADHRRHHPGRPRCPWRLRRGAGQA